MALSSQEFFRHVRALEAERDQVDRHTLTTFLSTALKDAGHVRLVEAKGKGRSPDLTGIVVVPIFWGLGASLGWIIETSWLAWLALSVGLLFAFGLLMLIPRLEPAGPWLLIVAWPVSAVLVGTNDAGGLVWTHGIPVALALVVALFFRSLALREARDFALALAGFGRSAPYVAPVVLVVILLPALTADVWRLASRVDAGDLTGTGAVTVGLLLFFVARQLRQELEPAFVARCRALTSQGNSPETTRSALLEALSREQATAVKELPAETLAEAWPTSGDEYVPYLVATEGVTLRRPLLARLFITAGTIGAFFATYVYVLLAMIVPTDVAAKWSGEQVGVRRFESFGIETTVPGGAYIAMAILLGTFATAIFLAFALTEERIAAAITAALLRDPIDRFLVLALPFVSSLEWVVENKKDLAQDEDSDPGTEEGTGSGSVSR